MEIVGRGYVAGACGVVPGNGKYTEEGTGPVDGDGVQFLEGLDKVVSVLLANIIDPKVVNDEEEIDEIDGVLPECRSSGNKGESKMGKVSFEPFVGDAAGVFEIRHAFSDLEVNPDVRTECAEVVLFEDFVRNTGQREFRVLVAGHGGAIVKILYIKVHEAGTGSEDGAVKLHVL